LRRYAWAILLAGALIAHIVIAPDMTAHFPVANFGLSRSREGEPCKDSYSLWVPKVALPELENAEEGGAETERVVCARRNEAYPPHRMIQGNQCGYCIDR